jgi:dihydrofolate reductase
MAGVVGRGAAVPPPRLRPDAPSAGAAGDDGTTFHFVTDGIESALEKAFDAAGGLDVRLGGGAATIAQYLRAGLVDEMHLAYVPLVLGGGERVFADPQCSAGYEVVEFVASEAVAHARFARRKA